MKTRKFKLLVLLFMLVFLLSNGNVMATGTGVFEVGAFWQPPAKPGTDYNTDTNWNNLETAGIDVISGHPGVPNGVTMNKTDNESGIAWSYANNVKLLCTDTGIRDKRCYTAQDYTDNRNLIAPYKDDPRVAGLYIKDEPIGFELEGYANAYRDAKAFAPNLQFLMNLFPRVDGIISTPGKLVFSNSGARDSGSYITSSNPMGQTFTVPEGISFIDGIDMFIDMSQWSTSETLTLKLWNSTAKTSKLGEASITGNGAVGEQYNYPYFRILADVTPGLTYYFELTHNGGGDNRVGWVVRSAGNVYDDGQAYENGVARTYDFHFRVYGKRENIGNQYENYVDEWLNISGADFIFYDHYPFISSTVSYSYFQNMEYIRGRGLAHDVRYGNFLQSGYWGVYNDPTADMLRWNVYTLLTYGHKMLWWFTYWCPDPSVFYGTIVSAAGTPQTKYSIVQTLNSEMHNLGNTLKNLISRRVFHYGSTIPVGTTYLPLNFFMSPTDLSQPVIIGTFTNGNGRTYVMVMNRDFSSSRNLTFRIAAKPSGMTEISKSTGSEVSLSGSDSYNSTSGVLTLTLNPGDGKLLAFPEGYDPYTNLAANAAVTATSSYESTCDGWGMNLVNDDLRGAATRTGDPSLYGWTSNNSLGTNHSESIIFDLGSSKAIAQVDLYPRNDSPYTGAGFPIDFNISTSADGTTWTPRVTKTGYALPDAKVQAFPFSSIINARYVKIEGTTLRTVLGEYRIQLSEVEIYSSWNYALNASSTASSSYESLNDGWGIAKVNDGIDGTYVNKTCGWSSNSNLYTNHTESITLDMKSSCSISRVDLVPRTDGVYTGEFFPVNFSIQTSTDNVNWTTQVTQTGNAKPDHQAQSFAFTATDARYVKIEGTTLRSYGNEYRMQFAEVKIR